METELIQKTRAYAEGILKKLPKHFTYHNLQHTLKVVNAAEEIGSLSGLSEDDIESVIIAAWIHDTGYEEDCDCHEETAIKNAIKLLTEWGASQQKIETIAGLIKATKMPQQPTTLAEKVLCDADLSHLGDDNIVECGNQIRKEFETIKKITFDTDEEWIAYNIKFFSDHQYFTPYGQTVLQKRKKKNIKKLKNLLDPATENDYVKQLEKELLKLKEKYGKENPARGIETMFRIASENHTTLSGMADTKANIMISINSIILSVVITVLFRKLEEFPHLLLPTLMLVTTCLLTIVYAILATRPNVSHGKFTPEDIQQKKTNLLFFGNFHGMELSNYDNGMRAMMKDSDFLYGSLIKDIYYNGLVLARKYKLLRLSYNCFMFGFVASIIGFTIALLIYYYPAALI
jgi:predicted metal-dependent HD superfamily phosphohydrolase